MAGGFEGGDRDVRARGEVKHGEELDIIMHRAMVKDYVLMHDIGMILTDEVAQRTDTHDL